MDRTETYLETSASAMFTYGFAHAVNLGWIDRTAVKDVALSGWQGIVPQVNAEGQMESRPIEDMTPLLSREELQKWTS